MAMLSILDPTDERVPVSRQITPRPKQITGNVALLDISKPRGNVLLDRLRRNVEPTPTGCEYHPLRQANIF